ncbi:MAG: redox-sensing transcriptional repressor Rex [Bacteroidetes bacterium HGW-Bacteroidetes-9]|jgi:redox-sensing transcriptional repressor|nr:MAG: redox-sensing transcriptional repressor Rex [Bacteroidetes bacterium HGW-Bacteroidetes-9]
MNKKLPDKTVERLSQYRRALMNYLSGGKHHIFSHEIANLLHITAVQVRRDIMLIGYTGTLRQGYDVKELIEIIGKIIDTRDGQKVAVIGIGNLGRAIMGYFSGKRTKLSIVAAFDINPEKIDKVYAGVQCYHIDQLANIIKSEGISIAVISVPGENAARVAELLVLAGIRGILNFSPKALNVPAHIYLQEYDMITMLEKIAYFVKKA